MEAENLHHDVGTLLRYRLFPSQHVAARHVDVWLPPGYDDEPDRRFPVLYMHDSQNVFIPEESYTHIDWGADEALARLMAADRSFAAIIVGAWNTERRFEEYMPQKPAQGLTFEHKIISDDYLRFLVEEVKPFVDATYRTLPGREYTSVMGSSMGGLISLYALCEYPDVFGGAGCVSTHWPVGNGIVVEYMKTALPDPRAHRIYFDHGDVGLDESYEPYQRLADEVMRKAGYKEGRNWITRAFPGADHSEQAWRSRVEIPLRFLLGKE